MKYFILLISLFLLSSCTSTPNIPSVKSAEKLVKQINSGNADINDISKQVSLTKQLAKQDLKNIQSLITELSKHVSAVWGKDNTELPSNKKFVKYTNNYRARTIVDFEEEEITVETLGAKNYSETLYNLKQAIITTLLTTADPSKTDIFSSEAPQLGGMPYLFAQVLDQDKKPIRYHWRASRYADYLLGKRIKKRQENNRNIYSIKMYLVEEHQHLRKQLYSQYVLAAAAKYDLTPSLIYGIIETESSFNPFAVSSSSAYGLMQVVPSTAGRDVYQRIKQTNGMPTKEQLFDPQFNIDIGTAYLHILKTVYLKKVEDAGSQHYTVISAYNGGAGNVLKTFHRDTTKAMDEINFRSAKDVYILLTKYHPKEEARRYLEKVTKAEKTYQ